MSDGAELTTLATVIVATVSAVCTGIYSVVKRKPVEGIEGSGVVAGSIIEKQLMRDLTATLQNLDGTARLLTDLLQAYIQQRRIDDEVAHRLSRELIELGIDPITKRPKA